MRRREAAQALRLAGALVLDSRLVGVGLALGVRPCHEHVARAAYLALEPEVAPGLVLKLLLAGGHASGQRL
jgi:hypothetical protein